MRFVGLCLALLASLLAAAPASALEQTLIASDGAEDDYFGWSVAVDGDTAVVGATQNFAGPGFVYVFTRDGDAWKQTARLQGSDTESGDHFGQSVAIDGDTIVVGAPRHIIGTDAAGAVYTFARTGAPNRTETAKLTVASPATATPALGSGVAVAGDVIAAGAPAEGSGPGVGGYGAVYLFDRTGDPDRHEKARLVASDGAAGDGLGGGFGLAIDGDTVVAGAYTKPASGAGVVNTGAAYTFDATATGAATQTDKLLASDGAALDQFGFSVDIDGETIVVGANRDSFPGRNYVGSAYTFESTGAHNQTSKLVTSDGKSEDRVGWDVAAGAQIAVAADLDDHGTSVTDEGSVYLYPRSSPEGERTEASRLTTSAPAAYDNFGSAVDMDGTTLIVGARSDDVGANEDQGSVTISFAAATAPACSDKGDNDGDGKIDFPDDPGCESADDTSEQDPPPALPPSDPPGGKLPGGVPAEVDDGSQAPRIVRPRRQPPVTPAKERTIKFATVWDCVDQPDGSPCKASAWVTIAYIADDGRALRLKKTSLRIASGRATIRSGAKKRATVKLTQEAYKLLRRRGKLMARVEMRMSRPGAETARTSFAVTIKAP